MTGSTARLARPGSGFAPSHRCGKANSGKRSRAFSLHCAHRWLTRLDLPIDHFGLLGVTPGTDAQGVLRTLQLRLDRAPDQGFTPETLEARAELLRASADLLSDAPRRSAYEADLTALTRSEQPVQPALEIPSSREVAGLLLLLEAGQPQECWDLARGCLQPPQAPALGSSREADLTLLAGLAALEAARECREQRRYEQAARLLQEGLQLLQRMGQVPSLRETMHRELEELAPYRVLDLLSRDLSNGAERREGMLLLEQLVQKRGGLEGDGDENFPSDQFQLFFKQIRGFLTVQEQVDLFTRWAEEGSSTAGFLAGIAMTASGFAQRKPERIAAAKDRFLASGRSGLEPLLANLHLLLGEVDQATALFEEGAAKDLRAWASRHSSDGLGRLCAYCRDWLTRDVLPGYRDLDVDPDLDVYFSDRDVVDWVEREDRRAGRHYVAAPAEPATLPPPTGGAFLGDFDWTFTPPWETADGESPALPPLVQESAPTVRRRRWSLPQPKAGLPRLSAWWLGSAAVALTLGAGIWALRPRPAAPPAQQPSIRSLPVLPHASVKPETPARPTPKAPKQAPGPGATPLPLTTAEPQERQLRDLLQAWLDAKAAVLAGKEPALPLDRLARQGPVERLEADRRFDLDAEQTQDIQAKIRSVAIRERTPQRIAVAAEIDYSDTRQGSDGKPIGRTPATTLRNVYVFGRDGDTWRLAATYSGQ